MEQSLLEVQKLALRYGQKRVVSEVSFTMTAGETIGIVGESGSGKSTILKAIMDSSAYGIQIEQGWIRYRGQDVNQLTRVQKRKLRGAEIGWVGQNPEQAFNPIRSYRSQFKETLKSCGRWNGRQSKQEILNCLAQLHLPEGERILKAHPWEMSGGMNQRISIALASILRPALLLADEPTSALDSMGQMQVMRELKRLQEETGAAILLVTHNIGLAARMCRRLIVMKQGKVMEAGLTQSLLNGPKDAYTKRLLASVPRLPKGKGK